MNIGDYVRTRDGIISKIEDNFNTTMCIGTDRGEYHYEYFDIIKSSPNIIDLVEYMDLLWLEHPIKLYDSDTTIGLFNPVRCDGFTTFEDGTHCIILNLDYIVDIKDLKIKGIITHEQIESMEYKVKE